MKNKQKRGNLLCLNIYLFIYFLCLVWVSSYNRGIPIGCALQNFVVHYAHKFQYYPPPHFLTWIYWRKHRKNMHNFKEVARPCFTLEFDNLFILDFCTNSMHYL